MDRMNRLVELAIAIVELSDNRSIFCIGAVELPHASLKHAWDLLYLRLEQLSFLVSVAPETAVATILSK